MDANHLLSLAKNSNIQDFSEGDAVKVHVKVKEGERERVQSFQGVVIRIRHGGPSSSFTVRHIGANGIGVERTFLFYSPTIEGVDVLRRGKVRRARLYYLRGLSGRHARIKEGGRLAAMTEAIGVQPEAPQETEEPPKAEVPPAPEGAQPAEQSKAPSKTVETSQAQEAPVAQAAQETATTQPPSTTQVS